MSYLLCPLLCMTLFAQSPGPRPPAAPILRLFEVGSLEGPLARRLGGAPAEGQLAAKVDELVRLYLPEAANLPRDALSLDPHGKTLIARVDAPRADWVTRFLARQAEEDARSIRIEASVFRLSEPEAAALELREAARVFRDPAEAARVVERIEQRAAAKERLPAVDTLPLAVARTSRTTPLPYVRDWRVYEKVEPGGKQIVDPVVEIIDEGAVLDARVVLLDGGELGIEVELTWRRVQRPIEVGKREVAGQTREVAVPRLDEVKVSSALVAPADSVAVLALPEGRQQVSVLVLRVGAPAPASRKR